MGESGRGILSEPPPGDSYAREGLDSHLRDSIGHWRRILSGRNESHTSSSLCQAPDLASWKPIHGFSSLPLLFFDLLLLPL